MIKRSKRQQQAITRLKQATKNRAGHKDHQELRVGAGYITNGHFIIHRGELIRQWLPLPEDASRDAESLRALGFEVGDWAVDEERAKRVLPDVTEESGVEYTQTKWTCHGEKLGPCSLVREVGGGRWCLVQVTYLALWDGMLLRSESGDHEGMILVAPDRAFGVMPIAKGARRNSEDWNR